MLARSSSNYHLKLIDRQFLLYLDQEATKISYITLTNYNSEAVRYNLTVINEIKNITFFLTKSCKTIKAVKIIFHLDSAVQYSITEFL